MAAAGPVFVGWDPFLGRGLGWGVADRFGGFDAEGVAERAQEPAAAGGLGGEQVSQRGVGEPGFDFVDHGVGALEFAGKPAEAAGQRDPADRGSGALGGLGAGGGRPGARRAEPAFGVKGGEAGEFGDDRVDPEGRGGDAADAGAAFAGLEGADHGGPQIVKGREESGDEARRARREHGAIIEQNRNVVKGPRARCGLSVASGSTRFARDAPV